MGIAENRIYGVVRIRVLVARVKEAHEEIARLKAERDAAFIKGMEAAMEIVNHSECKSEAYNYLCTRCFIQAVQDLTGKS